MSEFTRQDQIDELRREITVIKLGFSLLLRAANDEDQELYGRIIALLNNESKWAREPTDTASRANLDEVQRSLYQLFGISRGSDNSDG